MKLSPLRLLFISAIYTMVCTRGIAQQFTLKGKVVDEGATPVAFIDVMILHQDTQKQVPMAITNNDGTFSFTVSAGNYTILFKQFGVELLRREVYITRDINLGELIITVATKLEEVNISSRKKLIDRTTDRLIFNVENSLTAVGGDAVDILKITPGLSLQENGITMIGKSGLAVMIDDKPVPFSQEDLINYLKSVPSQNIKSIEVITSPPAKYDAEGNSGIINIKLKKAKDDTIGGNVRTSYSQATYAMGNITGGVTYQQQKFSFSSNATYSNGSNAPYQEYTITYPDYTWFETNRKRNFQNNFSARITSDYQVSPKTTVGIQYVITANKPLRKGLITSTITEYGAAAYDSLISTPSYIRSQRDIHALNLHSLTRLDTLGRQFTVDVDYFRLFADTHNTFSSTTYPAGLLPPSRYLAALNFSDQDVTIYTAKTDFEIPLRWLNLSFGAKVSFINNNSSATYFNTTTGTAEFDPLRSNRFRYTENMQAVHFSASAALGAKWNVKAGSRVENTQTTGMSQTLDQEQDNNYLKLFPTVYLTYNYNEKHTLALNYNRRINRPNYSQLNPFRFYTSGYNYGEGNPFLRPYFTDNFELNHIYGDNFLSLYASFISNGFDEVTFVSPENSLQQVRPVNFFRQTNIGMLDNYTFRRWDFWESNTTISAFYTKTYSNLEEIKDLEEISFSVHSANTFLIDKKKSLRAQLDLRYQSASVANSYNLSDFYSLDIGLRYDLTDSGLQFSINALDILRTNKLTFYQNVSGVQQKSYMYQDLQLVRFSLSWSFGKALKPYSRKVGNEEEKNRA